MDSPEKVGILFGGNDPINAFAVLGENKIYAVYNPDVKCIGFHEDTHLISATLGIPQSEFLLEGLAMFFDKTWWGLQNERWACYYKTKSQDISIKSMLFAASSMAQRGLLPVWIQFTKSSFSAL